MWNVVLWALQRFRSLSFLNCWLLPSVKCFFPPLRWLQTPPSPGFSSFSCFPSTIIIAIKLTFIQSDLQLIRLSKGQWALAKREVKGLAQAPNSWMDLHRGLNHQPVRAHSCTLAAGLQAEGGIQSGLTDPKRLISHLAMILVQVELIKPWRHFLLTHLNTSSPHKWQSISDWAAHALINWMKVYQIR